MPPFSKHSTLPVLNGLVGDKLGKNHPLRIAMSFRRDGRDVPVKHLGLAEALRDGHRHLTIFVHGLMLDEHCWETGSKEMPSYGALLERDFGHIALYVRYNSGLHISENGRALASLLQELDNLYGEQIKTLTLVGHSMGGLIVRSAGHYGNVEKQPWIARLYRVILLGTPHSGSHLEQFGHLVSFVLKTIWTVPTKVIGGIIDQRSNGIKDLRLGYMIDEDWQHKNATNLLHFKRTPLEPLPHTKYHVIAGSLHHDETSSITSYFGDGLVGKKSALKDDLGTYKVIPRTGHLALLRSRAVYDYVKTYFAEAP